MRRVCHRYPTNARPKAIVGQEFCCSAQSRLRGRSAGFQTCCIADFQVGSAAPFGWLADLEIRDTADLEVCATLYRGFLIRRDLKFREGSRMEVGSRIVSGTPVPRPFR